MKKILVLALILTMAVGTIAASAQGFVPPGQAKKGITEAEWMELMQMRQAQDDDNDESEEMYGPFRMLPPGLQNKGTPPGLEKRGLFLPPGQQKRADQGEELPPGIQMRFMETWQWRYEFGPVNPDNIFTVGSYDDLVGALENDEYEEENISIRLSGNIVLEEPIVISGDRRVQINGIRYTLTADDSAFDDEDWLIIVEEKGELYLNNVRLNGSLKSNDTLKGLVFVEEGGKLIAQNNLLSYAVNAFGFQMNRVDFDEDEAEDLADKLIKDNSFNEIEFYITIDDGDKILFNK